MNLVLLIGMILVLLLLSEGLSIKEGVDSCGPSPEKNTVIINKLQTQVNSLQQTVEKMQKAQASMARANYENKIKK